MIKVQCSKYPKQKCLNMENKNFELCSYCMHNEYMTPRAWQTEDADNFKEAVNK